MINAKEAREKSLLERQLLITQELSRVGNDINEAVLKGITEIKVDRLSTSAKDKLDELGYSHYDNGSQTLIQW